MLKNLARKIYNALPDNEIKKQLSCIAYKGLYNGFIKSYSYNGEYFEILLHNNIMIKSYKDFDPAPLYENFKDIKKQNNIVCLDLGGNIGAVAIYLAKYFGEDSKIVSFECDSHNIEIFKKNIELNNLNNIILIEKGVWKTSGELEFYSGGNYTSSVFKTNYVENASEDYKKIKIPTTTIDETVASLNLKNISIIKADIEGSELMALEGGIESIKKYKPIMIIETHIVDNVSNVDVVTKFLKDNGYSDIILRGDYKTPTIFTVN